MERQVLISFLGAGPKKNIDIGPVKESRAYNPAVYHFDDGTEIKTTFIADALIRQYGITDTILFGTTHSMWERVYEVFCKEQDAEAAEVYVDVTNHCDTANSKTPLTIPHREKVEKVLGGDSHIVLLRYGITEAEIRENMSIVLGIEEYLQDGDKLTIDITHSFRSLPLYIMNLLLYLRNISSKRITISRICYGMLDVSGEFNYTPVVSLNGIMELQDWITGAYNFMEFGNTYKIAGLLEKESKAEYGDAAKSLRGFADAKNLNRLREFRNTMSRLAPLTKGDHLPDIARKLIPGIISGFTRRFSPSLDDYVYQFRMAEWHERHHNSGYALIILVEAALSFCCYLVPDSVMPAELVSDERGTVKKDKEGNLSPVAKRDAVRRCLNYLRNDVGRQSVETLRNELKSRMELRGLVFSLFNLHYDTLNYDRNTIAHDLDRDKSYTKILSDLKAGLAYFRDAFSKV